MRHASAVLVVALAAVLFAPALVTAAQQPERTSAVVTHVVDGDTIDVVIVTTTYRVRYIGMDTPERGKPFFREATEANRRLVEGRTVQLEQDVSDTDSYDRLLRYVFLDDGTFVNAELVRLGYALVAYYPPDVRHFYLLASLQSEAFHACRGLWAPRCAFLPFTVRHAGATDRPRRHDVVSPTSIPPAPCPESVSAPVASVAAPDPPRAFGPQSAT